MAENNGIPQELIDRINELARKKKANGLTEAESAEQKELRQRYLRLFRQGFRDRIEMLRVYDDEGNEVTPTKLRDIQRKKGLRED
ncbi:DUF896 domain-containing protein [Ligilactobacillus saerimneri]|uniref:UPF0291 protein D271_06440 n=2 Tax=Ligilactobacillus saerimneri TaxID=228229 RepID=M5J7C7_9LACO|nr:DUF896 domain-containing protein [Ligilactobacillus saerimneri]EKW98624.1 hypothetical protein D271_06440 [Ligilactobacillus saerimneri 30a]KRL74991.1 hypothetical protein FC54_GL000143 [Ligilactobacillus saerimneri DSM 16049]MBU5309024.1 DUF896 domain-containing protein [Ligilactobacillus saerimneri]MCZ0891653.1 DUF896 domain-containing protein [Ligilactobacillus saerimneri]MDI9205667.1 DUF896 domain-containing protein [Ligilactobacillus saerimneri]